MIRIEDDRELTQFYEGNGLFAKIIDTPAEEAFRCGFTIKGVVPGDGIENAVDLLEWLQWEETATTAVKWARLFGGSMIVMLINDGGGIEEPLRLEKVRSVDGLIVYDRSIVRPTPVGEDCSSYPMPEYYQVFSRHGTFTVHASRCLIFRNGSELSERTTSGHLWPWGIPEAYRIWKALREAETAHGSAARLLDKSIQSVQKVQGLSQLLETPEGETQVSRNLEILDLSRGLYKTVAVSVDDEFSYMGEIPEGIGKVVNVSDQMLSTVTGIPEIILWGKPIDYERPGQMLRKHDDTSMETWYSYVEGIQTGMVKNNLRRLLSIIFQSEANSGALPQRPKFDIEFSKLWSINDVDLADIAHGKAEQQRAKAEAAALYVGMGAVTPEEVRRGLKNRKVKKCVTNNNLLRYWLR